MIKINGQSGDNRMMVCLTDIPNIVSYEVEDSGKKARMIISVGSEYPAHPNKMIKGATITIGKETITSVIKLEEAKGRYFYLGTNFNWVPQTIVDALRNCPIISANYNIFLNGMNVIIEARTNGSKWNFDDYSTTVDGSLISISTSEGTSTDSFKNEKNAKLMLSIWAWKDCKQYKEYELSEIMQNGEYVTTLEKTYYESNVSFDISPVLQTICDYGKLTCFRLVLTMITSNPNRSYGTLLEQNNLFAMYGYKANSSQSFIHRNNAPMVLLNYGNGIKNANLHTLYLRKPYIDFSWISRDATDVFKYRYDNGNAVSISFNNLNGFDHRIILDEDKLKNTKHVYVELPSNKGTVEYTVIQGLKLNDRCTRINWRNEYGGISFYDFTGTHSEEVGLDTDTYSKSDFDYYNSSESEKIKVFRRDVTHRFTVSSHIVDEMGTKQIESLAKSKKAWIEDEENNIIRDIIVSDIKINKNNDYDNIYNCSVTYSMSRED